MIDHRSFKPGRFGRLPTKRPCVECPLARNAKPGHLGGYSVAQYLDVLHGPADIACHLSPGFPHDLSQQRSCTGVAMYRAALGLAPWGHAARAIAHVADEPNARPRPRQLIPRGLCVRGMMLPWPGTIPDAQRTPP